MLKIHRKQILTDPEANQRGKRGKQKQEIEYKKETYYFRFRCKNNFTAFLGYDCCFLYHYCHVYGI